MSETLNTNPTEQPLQLDPAMQSLADMAGQMGEQTEAGEKMEIGEKYYEQAKRMKDGWIEEAKKRVVEEEEADLDEIARCCKNQEFLDRIDAKLKAGEDFDPEEMQFLGEPPKSLNEHVFAYNLRTPEIFHKRGVTVAFRTYEDILKRYDDGKVDQFTTFALAQMREMQKQDQGLSRKNNEI